MRDWRLVIFDRDASNGTAALRSFNLNQFLATVISINIIIRLRLRRWCALQKSLRMILKTIINYNIDSSFLVRLIASYEIFGVLGRISPFFDYTFSFRCWHATFSIITLGFSFIRVLDIDNCPSFAALQPSSWFGAKCRSGCVHSVLDSYTYRDKLNHNEAE